MQAQLRARGMRLIDLTNVQLGSSETARRINRDIVLELIRPISPSPEPMWRASQDYKGARSLRS